MRLARAIVCPFPLVRGSHVGVAFARLTLLACLIFAPALLFVSRQRTFTGNSVSGCGALFKRA